MSPGTFWAYHGSSGPLEAIYDYWQYFQPIQEGMPRNCSLDYSAIIDHVDQTFMQGSDEDKRARKYIDIALLAKAALQIVSAWRIPEDAPIGIDR